MNSTRQPKRQVVIAYNDYMPLAARKHEAAAEQATATVAREAAIALRVSPWRPTLLPVRNNITAVCARLNRLKPAAIINLCEAFAGHPHHEAYVAGLWAMLGIPFTGNTPQALLLCQNKFQTKLLMRAAGIDVPDGWQAEKPDDVPAFAGQTLIVKPVAEDGGIGIYDNSIVKTPLELADRISRIRARYHQPALVEKYIAGREFNLTIIERAQPEVLPIAEILFQNLPQNAPRLVGYNAKWRPRHPAYRATVPRCPARLPAHTASKLRQAALQAWSVAGLRGYARFDFRMNRAGRIYLLEINPNPDTAADAGLARALTAAGISLTDFWQAQLQLAVNPGAIT